MSAAAAAAAASAPAHAAAGDLIALRISADTMARAAAAIAGGTGGRGARVVANDLRELDRFLSVLIDAVAAAARPAGLDRTWLARRRNTAAKLGRIRAALGVASPDDACPDDAWLRAIGRARDRLFHSEPPTVDRSIALPAWFRASGIGRASAIPYARIAIDLVAAGDAYRLTPLTFRGHHPR